MDSKTLQALIMARDLLNGIIDHEEQSDVTSGQETSKNGIVLLADKININDKIPWVPIMENNPCNVCGNIKKPTTEHNGQYYCQRCKEESANVIMKGDLLKRKHCFICSAQLPGFYKLENCDAVICYRCESEDKTDE